jgi:hypothetical protein
MLNGLGLVEGDVRLHVYEVENGEMRNNSRRETFIHMI